MKDATFSSARLLALYDRISDAEDAIPRLRRFVLDLAVRGKLMEQDAEDEPAAELLSRISICRSEAHRSGQKAKKTNSIVDFEPEFEAPSGWLWTSLSAVATITQGFAYSSNDYSADPNDGMPLIKIGDIGSDQPIVFVKTTIDPNYLVKKGDLLLGLSGSIKCAFWAGPDALLNQRIARIRPVSDDLDNAWLFQAVNFNIDKWKAETSKLTVQNVKASQLNNAPFPLPPLAEQHRIVAKVDELMALCDQLEQARAGREAVRDRLTTASLARLTAPETDADTFQSQARFALQSLPTLTTRPDQIKTLRQTILNLAVRGKLVKQDQERSLAEDQAALSKIETERLSLSKNRSDEARVVTEFELIWKQWAEAPSGERKITTFCACHFITKGTTPSKSGLLEKAEVPFLKVYNIVQNQLDFAYRPIFVARETHEKALARSKVFPNDVIMNIVGPPLGKVAIVTDEYPEWNINQALAFFRPLAAFSSSYIAIMLKAPNSLKEILGETRGTVGQDNLSLEQVRSISFPFMPLAEQHCIVAKVDALMALCDQLEASLTTTATTRSKLLNALLHEALSPNAEAAQ